MCSNDVTMSESVHHDEAFGAMNRKRQCSVRSPFEATATTRREDSSDVEWSGDEFLVDGDKKGTIRFLVSQWSERVIEGMKYAHSSKELKRLLCEHLNEFYRTVCVDPAEDATSPRDPQEETVEDLKNKVNQLLHRNNILCNVIRHQYDSIRKLQATEAQNANLIKEKADLTDQLRNLKHRISLYINSIEGDVAPGCGAFDSNLTRGPPDVC